MTALLFSASTVAPSFAHADRGGVNVEDPWEGFNRAMFSFNDTLDRWFLEPVARGWDFVVPDVAQTAVSNIFANALFPIDFTNELLQGKPRGAVTSFSRFLVNSTLGVGGIFDHGDTLGLEENHEDFGQTFAVWGVGSGPYLMLPFFGPSNPRDGVGFVLDSAARIWPYYVEDELVVTGIAATELINKRASLLDEIETARESSLDYYAAVRNLYQQQREAAILDGEASDTNSDADGGEDLYFYDE